MTTFDSLICVDYSAAAVPTQGEDSIWVGGQVLGRPILHNFPTRHELHGWLRAHMHQHLDQGKRLLAGFDFAFGYPRGFAAALGLDGTPWAATWALLHAQISDGPKNQNNRFHVADALNARLGARALFWGRPSTAATPHLPAKRTVHYDQGVGEWRAFEIAGRTSADRRIGRMQPGWKLAYTGSVGSQALMGIARLEAHRREFGEQLAIWPFEAAHAPLVFAEIYPSMFPCDHLDHPIKDARQVLAVSEAMAAANLGVDLKGDLGADPKAHPAADLAQWLDRDQFADDPEIVAEEGWLLSWLR